MIRKYRKWKKIEVVSEKEIHKGDKKKSNENNS